jgi:3-carboxy-cis,cis-muconate cycloisomerase
MQSEADDSLFSDEALWQAWLDVECALAIVQGEEGIIPQWAAERISASAQLHLLDQDKLRFEISQTMAPVFALTNALSEHCGEAGAYVHWGATTQNIIDAGLLLNLRKVQSRLSKRLAQALNLMAKLAADHANTAMIGRTNRQHALPITFGFKVASWIDEMIRVCDQLKSVEPRLFQLCFGGAIGAFQSSGEKGPDLAEKLALRLNLRPGRFQGRTQIDPQIEYISRLSMFGVAVSRMSSELYILMGQETGEIAETLNGGVVGSSTMPHKINPKYVVSLTAKANLLRGKAGAAFTVTTPSHEGDAVTNRELKTLMQESCSLALDLAGELVDFLSVLEVNQARMNENLASSGDFTSMERLMMYLAPWLGRGRAHDLLHEIVHHSGRNPDRLRKLILAEPALTEFVDASKLDRLLDPFENTGQSQAIANELAAAGLECAALLVQSEISLTDEAISEFSQQLT